MINYKKKLLCIILVSMSLNMAFGQIIMYKKIYEPVHTGSIDNIRSKNDLQRIFFPDNKGLVEFFEAPSFQAAFGFRVVKNDSNNYTLEIKQIKNWKAIEDKLMEDFPFQVVPDTLLKEERNEIGKLNVENNRKRNEARKNAIEDYIIETKEVDVSNDFALAIHSAFEILIDNYKNKNIYSLHSDGSKIINALIQFDGSQFTFRCVVEDELRTFIVSTTLREIDKLAKICNNIYNEVIHEDIFNDIKYTEELKKLIM